MLNRKADTIEVLSYRELGNLALRLARNDRKGFTGSKRQLALWGKASTIRHLLKALESRERLDYKVANKLLSCLVKISDINDFPAAPLLLKGTKPTILFKVGEKGEQGNIGNTGSDATVDVVEGDDTINVAETTPGGIRTFTLSYNPYSLPTISTSIDTGSLPSPTSKYREYGESLTVNLNITVTKGRNDVVTSVITSDAGLDLAYQGYFDETVVNANGFQTITGVNETLVVDDTTYTTDVTDDQTPTPGTAVNSDNIYFHYPILYGSSATLIANHYGLLSKVVRGDGGIQTKQTTTVTFNGTGHYFYFAVPGVTAGTSKTDYGLLTSIKDQSGFEHLAAADPTFLETTGVSVTSSGAGQTNPWTIDYTVYRTKVPTNITNGNYTFSWQ